MLGHAQDSALVWPSQTPHKNRDPMRVAVILPMGGGLWGPGMVALAC